jgi:hypothetical protein
MYKHYSLLIATIAIVMLNGCDSYGYLEIDVQQLQDKMYTAQVHDTLSMSTTLYLDHSTCIIEADKKSLVFAALKPQLGQYSDTLQLIKGANFDTIVLNRQANRVFQALATIQSDIPYADVRKAFFDISKGNQQAILISDCEYLEVPSGSTTGLVKLLPHDTDPYMTEPFINWLRRGYSIYLIVEPYQEIHKGTTYDKKRFYFIFTDDRLSAPISNNLLNQLKTVDNSFYKIFRFTNSDLTIHRDGDLVSNDLSVSTFEEKIGFEYVTIDDSWDAIREYLMKLDEYDEPIEGETAIPIIQNLTFNEGVNYTIDDIKIIATNVTSQYIALSDSTITPQPVSIPDGFALDKDAFANHRINVLFTNQIFKYINDEYGGNLIRLDFVIKNAHLNSLDEQELTWRSLYSGDQAICVAKSLENALLDISVFPTTPNRQLLHTVFIKTEGYKQ